jgi:hypothetical protein
MDSEREKIPQTPLGEAGSNPSRRRAISLGDAVSAQGLPVPLKVYPEFNQAVLVQIPRRLTPGTTPKYAWS